MNTTPSFVDNGILDAVFNPTFDAVWNSLTFEASTSLSLKIVEPMIEDSKVISLLNEQNLWAESSSQSDSGIECSSINRVIDCSLIDSGIEYHSVNSVIEYRSIDGTINNPTDEALGSVKQMLIRIGAPTYEGGSGLPTGRPNPRLISNHIFSQKDSVVDNRGLSDYVWVWGQFIDHDIDLTPLQSGDGAETINIEIPDGDAIYQAGQVIPVTRSILVEGTGTDSTNPRQQPNVISAWIDAGVVYGNDYERAEYLRTGTEGKLKVSDGNLLPIADEYSPSMAGPANSYKFVAGDVRANEHSALTTMHTLFVREHNRLAEFIDENYSDLPNEQNARDEAIYQIARKIVGAELQAITYNEYLPALGVNVDCYRGYNSHTDPSVSTEFATAGYRMGHSQIGGTILRLDDSGNSIEQGKLDLVAAFFDGTKIAESGGIDSILKGLSAQVQEATDTLMADGLRNLLFSEPNPESPVTNGTDLAALNIQRGRDHGLPSYNQGRIAYGLAPKKNFNQITKDVALANKLKEVYGNIDKLDLWVGLLAEDKLPNSSIGELNQVILNDQFTRLREGDRFFYLNDLESNVLDTWLAPEDGFDGSTLDWLNNLQLSDIIQLNTEVENVQDNIFYAQLTVKGDDNDNTLIGYNAPDTLLGMGGDDILLGGFNSNIYEGGEGSDMFVIGQDQGSNTITDFELQKDIIGLSGGITFEDLQFCGNLGSDHTTISLKGEGSSSPLAILEGITKKDLIAYGDFVTLENFETSMG